MHACRICYEPGELISVCECSGTMKYVHEECIVKWIRLSQRETCEICHGSFNIHVEPAPKPAPVAHILFGMSVSIIHAILLNQQLTLFPNDAWSVIMLSVVINTIQLILWDIMKNYGIRFQSMAISIWIMTFLLLSFVLQRPSLELANLSYVITIICYLIMSCVHIKTASEEH